MYLAISALVCHFSEVFFRTKQIKGTPLLQLVAMKAWDALGLTPILQNLGMNPTAIATAQVMISNHLIEPLSEWALIDWAHRTALPELLDVRLSKTTKDRLYRISDELLKHRKPIETTLHEKSRDLFSLRHPDLSRCLGGFPLMSAEAG